MNVPNQASPNSGAPGIALLIIGIFALLSSAGLALRCYFVVSDPGFVVAYEQQLQDMPAEQRKAMSQWGDPAEVAKTSMYVMIAISGLGILLSAAMILGGFGLIKGKKGLGLLGGAAALIPNWCCLLSFPIGIWAIVVALRLGNAPSPPHDPSKVELHV